MERMFNDGISKRQTKEETFENIKKLFNEEKIKDFAIVLRLKEEKERPIIRAVTPEKIEEIQCFQRMINDDFMYAIRNIATKDVLQYVYNKD